MRAIFVTWTKRGLMLSLGMLLVVGHAYGLSSAEEYEVRCNNNFKDFVVEYEKRVLVNCDLLMKSGWNELVDTVKSMCLQEARKPRQQASEICYEMTDHYTNLVMPRINDILKRKKQKECLKSETKLFKDRSRICESSKWRYYQ